LDSDIYFGGQRFLLSVSEHVGCDEPLDRRRQSMDEQTSEHIRPYILRRVYARINRSDSYVDKRGIIWVKLKIKFSGGKYFMIREAILLLAKKQDLTYETAEAVMNEIMTGEATPVQMSAYLTALSLKGETTDEITASASGMRRHCVRLLHDVDALEIVGTGGDHANTFNISTAAAIITAAAGIPVAKHGNRSASSRCGSADVLEALGVNINIPPEKSAELLKNIGICFMFAQNYHIAMKFVAPIRRELGIRTVFNIIGPLTNPAGAKMELMGVYDRELVEPLAQVLCNLGVKSAMVVHGDDGLDEISLSAPTFVCEVQTG